MRSFEQYDEARKYFAEGKQKDNDANEVQKQLQLHDNKSFINSANFRSMHNSVENCIFFNICVDNHLKLSLNWFLFVYFNKILILDLINHV